MYDFTPVWDIKLKATQTSSQKQTTEGWLPWRWGWVGDKEDEGVDHMMTEGDWPLGGEHTMEYTDVSQSCTPESYIMITKVFPMNLI